MKIVRINYSRDYSLEKSYYPISTLARNASLKDLYSECYQNTLIQARYPPRILVIIFSPYILTHAFMKPKEAHACE